MKITLTFEDDADGNNKLYQITNAESAYLVLWDLLHQSDLRVYAKHGVPKDKFESVQSALIWVRDLIFDHLDKHNIDLDRALE